MNQFLKILSIFELFLVMVSCTVPKECTSIHEEYIPEVQPVLHLTNNSPVLYQADFEVFKYHFSGLIAFRNDMDNHEIRIVFLTEVGLKLMEFSFTGNKMVNTFCSPVITKKSIPKFTGDFLSQLIEKPECRSICFYREGEKNKYFSRKGSKKIFLTAENGNRNEMEIRVRGEKGVKSYYPESDEIPDIIVVKMRYSTTIMLKRVSNAFK